MRCFVLRWVCAREIDGGQWLWSGVDRGTFSQCSEECGQIFDGLVASDESCPPEALSGVIQRDGCVAAGSESHTPLVRRFQSVRLYKNRLSPLKGECPESRAWISVTCLRRVSSDLSICVCVCFFWEKRKQRERYQCAGAVMVG